MRHSPIENCMRKLDYTREEACYATERIYRQQGERLKAYKCPVCIHWHIGHQKILSKNIGKPFPGQIRGITIEVKKK